MQHSFLRHFDRINDKYGAWLFYIGLFLMIICRYRFAGNKEIPDLYFSLYYFFRHVGRIFLILRILLFSHKYPLYVLSCICLFGIIWYSHCLSGWNVLTYSFIIIAASKDTDIRKIQQLFLIAFLIVLFTVPTFWCIGWAGEVIKHKFGQVGHSFGFPNPNTLAFLFLMFILLVLQYWKINQIRIAWIICWMAASMVLLLTMSLTTSIILFIIPIVYYFLKRNMIPAWGFALLPLFCLLTSILLSYYYGPSYGGTTFESRFSIPALVYQNYGLSLFGQEYGYVNDTISKQTGAHLLCVDNVFMHLVLCDGVMIALLVFCFLGHYLYKISKTGNLLLISSFIGLTISGTMEEVLLDAKINFLLLYYFHSSAPPSSTFQEVLDP